MRQLIEERRELNTLRIRKEMRRQFVAEKRAILLQLTEEEKQSMVVESIHFYEEQLSHPKTPEEFTAAVNNLNELISTHGKSPQPDSIACLLAALQTRQNLCGITRLLVNATSLEKVDKSTIDMVSASILDLVQLSLQSNDLVVIENVLYIIGNTATESTVQKEKLTATCTCFFSRLNELIRDKNMGYQFCDSLLWVYTNILIRNKESYHDRQYIGRPFNIGLVVLLNFLLMQFATGVRIPTILGPTQTALIEKVRSRSLRLVTLLITLNTKEEVQALWMAGLQQCVGSCVTIVAEMIKEPLGSHIFADILEVLVAAHSANSGYLPPQMANLIITLVQTQQQYLFRQDNGHALESVIELVRCLKNEPLTIEFLNRFELLWHYQPNVALVHKLSKFLVELFGSTTLEKTCADRITLKMLMRRVASMLDYENEEIVLNGLRCILFLSDKDIDEELLRGMLEEVGLTQRIVSLQMHENRQTYELAMELLQILDIRE